MALSFAREGAGCQWRGVFSYGVAELVEDWSDWHWRTQHWQSSGVTRGYRYFNYRAQKQYWRPYTHTIEIVLTTATLGASTIDVVVSEYLFEGHELWAGQHGVYNFARFRGCSSAFYDVQFFAQGCGATPSVPSYDTVGVYCTIHEEDIDNGIGPQAVLRHSPAAVSCYSASYQRNTTYEATIDGSGDCAAAMGPHVVPVVSNSETGTAADFEVDVPVGLYDTGGGLLGARCGSWASCGTHPISGPTAINPLAAATLELY